MQIYESLPTFYIITGGHRDIIQFESLSIPRMCIGGIAAEVFYESSAIEATASVIYAWGRDINTSRVSNNIAPAMCVKITEI